jgi:hypothetical protein
VIEAEATGIRPLIAPAMIAVAAAAILTIAASPSRSIVAGPEAAPSPSMGYLPSISDLMIATIQPRHDRLWRAEQDGNSDFAAYELGNLKAHSARTRPSN